MSEQNIPIPVCSMCGIENSLPTSFTEQFNDTLILLYKSTEEDQDLKKVRNVGKLLLGS